METTIQNEAPPLEAPPALAPLDWQTIVDAATSRAVEVLGEELAQIVPLAALVGEQAEAARAAVAIEAAKHPGLAGELRQGAARAPSGAIVVRIGLPVGGEAEMNAAAVPLPFGVRPVAIVRLEDAPTVLDVVLLERSRRAEVFEGTLRKAHQAKQDARRAAEEAARAQHAADKVNAPWASLAQPVAACLAVANESPAGETRQAFINLAMALAGSEVARPVLSAEFEALVAKLKNQSRVRELEAVADRRLEQRLADATQLCALGYES